MEKKLPPGGQAWKEYWQNFYAYQFSGSSEYLNRQLDERLNDLANILPTSLSTNPALLATDLRFLKRPEPTGATIDEVVEHNRQIDEFAKAFEEGGADAICDYFELVLQCSIYPDGFHKGWRIAYANESGQSVVDYQLPTVDEIVPTVERYKTTAQGDVTEFKKKERARQQVYGNVIASTVLRTLHDVIQADQNKYIDVVPINAFVETIDRGTGHKIRPYILSVPATRDEFERLNLQQVDPSACLKRLTATVSRSPAELVPIKPIVDINMFDSRFVQEQNIIAELDNRTNLMTLSPGEFESLGPVFS